MLSTIYLLTFLPFLPSTINAATPSTLPSPSDLTASNTGLTHLINPIDSVVVALTANTPLEIAQTLPPSLYSLTTAIAANIDNATLNSGDVPAASTLVHSFGLFANSVEELMFDFAKQNLTLKGIGGGGVQGEMFEAVGGFNGTFHEYARLVLEVVTGAKGKKIVGYNTLNATLGINAAAKAYAPSPVIAV